VACISGRILPADAGIVSVNDRVASVKTGMMAAGAHVTREFPGAIAI